MAAVRARCVLLTGSNRGIGLELVRQLLGGPQPPTHVFATCRDPEGPRGKVSVRVGAAEGWLRACGCGAAEVRAAGRPQGLGDGGVGPLSCAEGKWCLNTARVPPWFGWNVEQTRVVLGRNHVNAVTAQTLG